MMTHSHFEISTGTVSPSATRANLIGAIRAARSDVGDALTEVEFTHLLRADGLPAEAGFSFLCLCDGYVTFRVPRHDVATWYAEGGWLAVPKEETARALAAKYGLQMYEPPDDTAHSRHAPGLREIHHHIVFGNTTEDLIIAHPRYLKIRVFCTDSATRHLSDAKLALLLGRDLLQDLSALYTG